MGIEPRVGLLEDLFRILAGQKEDETSAPNHPVLTMTDDGRVRVVSRTEADQIQNRMQEEELTVDDRLIIREGLRQVVVGEALNPREENRLLEGLTSEMGAMSHYVTVDSPDGTSYAVNSLREGMLRSALMLAEGPIPIHEGLRAYLNLHPGLRDYFIDNVITLDTYLGALETLKADSREKRQWVDFNNLNFFLNGFNDEFSQLLTEHGSLSTDLYQGAVVQLLHDKEPVTWYRVHVNMTSINEKDPHGQHGNLFLAAMLAELKMALGEENVALNPENTTFSFVGETPSRVRSLLKDLPARVKLRLQRSLHVDFEVVSAFDPALTVSYRTIGKKDLLKYALRSIEDVETYSDLFRFTKIDLDTLMSNLKGYQGDPTPIFEQYVGTKRLRVADVLATQDARLIALMQALCLQALAEMNRELAAQTTFFEKHSGRKTGEWLYGSERKPKSGRLLTVWEDMQKRGAGFVGPGRYDARLLSDVEAPAGPLPHLSSGDERDVDFTALDLPTDALRVLQAFPRHATVIGAFSHNRPGTKGGALQRFQRALQIWKQLPDTASPDHGAEAVAGLKAAASDLRGAAFQFYNAAVTHPRRAGNLKTQGVFTLSGHELPLKVRTGFVTEAVALGEYRILAVLEMDSLKAYLEAYPSNDLTDSGVNRVKDIFEGMGARVILSPDWGDHMRLWIPRTDATGRVLDPEEAVRGFQAQVKEAFAQRSFHDKHKVNYVNYNWEIMGVSRDLAQIDGVKRALKNHFHLNADVVVELKGEDLLMMSVPAANRKGQVVTRHAMMEFLKSHFYQSPVMLRQTASVKRLPMWHKLSSTGSIRRWHFGEEPRRNFTPFMRTLTVSMVVGSHEPIRKPSDLPSLHRLQGVLNARLVQAKGENWPDKQGYALVERDDEGSVVEEFDGVQREDAQAPDLSMGTTTSRAHVAQPRMARLAF